MSKTSETGKAYFEREPTGISGLDEILHGGLFRGGIYMVTGRPGAGKTILASQIASHQVAQGRNVVFATLLSETHGRLVANLGTLSFFDPSQVGTRFFFANGYTAIEQQGLGGLLKVLQSEVRERKCSLLVIDGMVTVEALAQSVVAYKKFIQELQAWVELNRCTVLILTSLGTSTGVGPEHTMVDGILEMGIRAFGSRSLRELTVSKFRGSGISEGRHAYRIAASGIHVFPRLEGQRAEEAPVPPGEGRCATGVRGLDDLLSGGFTPSSLCLLFGPSGSGKTVLGLQFLEAGARANEPGLHFGFYENPPELTETAARLGCDLSTHLKQGKIHFIWQPPAECLLDELGHRLLDAVRAHGARRLVIDGLMGFKEGAAYPERIGAFFAVMAERLRALGVTTLLTEETRDLYFRDIDVPMSGISAAIDNVVLLRQVEVEGRLRRVVSVMKTRGGPHDADLHTYSITDRGMVVGRPFDGGSDVLTGMSRAKARTRKRAKR